MFYLLCTCVSLRNRLQREKERDVSEMIALGLPNTGAGGSKETQFDQRLFNQSKVRELFMKYDKHLKNMSHR